MVEYNAVVDSNAERVWGVLKQFGAISAWHPAIPESYIEDGQPDGLVGCIRRLTLQDGAILREQLLMLDARNRSFSYRFVESPLPLDNYVATVKLVPLTDHDKTVVQWIARFDTRDSDPRRVQTATVQELIVSGHTSLQRYLGSAQKN